MLSRHAELLFWAGRYLERTALTGRFLDATQQRLLEVADPAEEWRQFLGVLYLDEVFAASHEEFTGEAVNEFLITDTSHPGSILAAVTRARLNLQEVREVVPLELLEAVNKLYHDIRSPFTARQIARSPWDFHDRLRIQCQTSAGVIHDAMARTDGYHFLVLGRMIERAEMTSRIIDANRGDATDEARWVRVLRTVSGLHAFVQRHGATASTNRIVEFLLVDPDSPCSVLFCLRRCEAELHEAYRDVRDTSAQRLLGRLRARVEFGDVPAVDDPALGLLLDDLQVALGEVAESLRRDLFPAATATLHSYEAL
jgi:uncharacterized alpha-E superfamily protein